MPRDGEKRTARACSTPSGSVTMARLARNANERPFTTTLPRFHVSVVTGESSRRRAPRATTECASQSQSAPYPPCGRGCEAPSEPPSPHSSRIERALTRAGSAASKPCTIMRAKVFVFRLTRVRARS